MDEAVDKVKPSEGGQKFSIFMDLGITDKKVFRTVRVKGKDDDMPVFITAHREDRKK